MKEWIFFRDELPKIGQLIAAIRTPWPEYYWIGEYMGAASEEEDQFDWWIPVPKIPHFE